MPPSSADDDIAALADRLRTLRAQLGTGYWQDAEVRELQAKLRKEIGSYAAWGEDKPPTHQRARKAARYESELAPLLWPGRGGD